MIVFDENVEQHWIELFSRKGYSYLSIRDSYKGLADEEIIKIISQNSCVLITEDKDFGELVFAHGITSVSIIFIRYDQPHYELIENNLIDAVEIYYKNPISCFITVTKNQIRIRKL